MSYTEYKHNKAFDLSIEEQNNILRYLNTYKFKYDNKLISAEDFYNEINKVQKILSLIDIEVQYDWEPFHHNEFFFPTYIDYEDAEDYYFSHGE